MPGGVAGMSPAPHGHLALAGAGSDPAELSIPRAAAARWDLFPRYTKSSPSTKPECFKSKTICIFMPERALLARGINRTQRNQVFSLSGYFYTKVRFLSIWAGLEQPGDRDKGHPSPRARDASALGPGMGERIPQLGVRSAPAPGAATLQPWIPGMSQVWDQGCPTPGVTLFQP